MKYKYAFKTDKENVVKVVGRDVNMSRKQAIEMCDFVRNKPTAKMIPILEKVQDAKLAVPFHRFTEGAGHKKGVGMASGKYPLKGATLFISLLKSLETNAQNKGLGSDLLIIHACAQQAARPFHSGRKRRIRMKRVHIELAAVEMEAPKKESKEKSKAAKQENKKATENNNNQAN
jgi:large subunit ribosomal protein L22